LHIIINLHRRSITFSLFLFSFVQSNSTPHSEEDDKHSEHEHDYPHSPPQKYLDESPPHDDPEAFAQQQRELLERLKEQFTSFPFHQASVFPGLDLTTSEQHRKPEAPTESFPFSFPTPPPSKSDESVKLLSSSATKKNGSSQNNSWTYEDQFKQVRQVS
jgi:hypothetical protein